MTLTPHGSQQTTPKLSILHLLGPVGVPGAPTQLPPCQPLQNLPAEASLPPPALQRGVTPSRWLERLTRNLFRVTHKSDCLFFKKKKNKIPRGNKPNHNSKPTQAVQPFQAGSVAIDDQAVMSPVGTCCESGLGVSHASFPLCTHSRPILILLLVPRCPPMAFWSSDPPPQGAEKRWRWRFRVGSEISPSTINTQLCSCSVPAALLHLPPSPHRKSSSHPQNLARPVKGLLRVAMALANSLSVTSGGPEPPFSLGSACKPPRTSLGSERDFCVALQGRAQGLWRTQVDSSVGLEKGKCLCVKAPGETPHVL